MFGKIFGVALMMLVGMGSAEASALDLVTGNDYAPFTDETLPEGGMLTEVVQRAFAEAGQQHTVRFVAWKRGYDATVAGRYAATFPYVRTPEREPDVLFSAPLIEVRQLVFHNPAGGLVFRKPDDLRGRVACMPIGYALPPELQAMADHGQLKRESPRDLGACARMTASGRTDFFVIDEFAGRSSIVTAGLEKSVVAAETAYATVPQFLIVSRRHPDAERLLADFNAGLAKLKASGGYDAIVRRHVELAIR